MNEPIKIKENGLDTFFYYPSTGDVVVISEELPKESGVFHSRSQEIHDKCNWLKQSLKPVTERISQLESSLAELQRVVQVKDEALLTAGQSLDHLPPISAAHSVYKETGLKACSDARALTPTNLPKFVPEEEYLRVKEEFAELKTDIEALHEIQKQDAEYNLLCANKFDLLKSHAEAMAEELSYAQQFEGLWPESVSLRNYRKDFPKP